jgi:hypothetical protein
MHRLFLRRAACKAVGETKGAELKREAPVDRREIRGLIRLEDLVIRIECKVRPVSTRRKKWRESRFR